MEDNVFSEGDGSEEVQKSGTGEDGDRARDKTPSQPSSSPTKVRNNRAQDSKIPTYPRSAVRDLEPVVNSYPNRNK